MQNLYLLENLAEAFQYNEHRYQCLVVLAVLQRLQNIDNGAHGTEKPLLNTQVSGDFA